MGPGNSANSFRSGKGKSRSLASGRVHPLSYNSTQYKAPSKPLLRGLLQRLKSESRMTHTRFTVLGPLRLLALAAAMMLSTAHADEYADVAQLVRGGKLPEALSKADQYLATKPRDPQMRFLKGVIQRDSGKTTDAIATFTRLTEDFPELPEPYNNLAVLYAGQSQFDKARMSLEMAIRTNPSYATAHENLGDVYAKLASQAYNKALQLDGANAGVPPKLALIRELFSPTGAKNQRPVVPPVAAPAVPTPVAAKPAPTLLGPVAGKPAPAATPAVTAAASTPAVAPTTPPAVVPAPAVTAPTTPATATPAPAPTAAPSGNSAREAEAAVIAWAKAWAARDVKAYLASYGKDFTPPGSMSRSAWEEERRQRISSKAKITVKLENLTVTVSANSAVAKFRQDYKASGLAVSSRKTLELVKVGDRWQIVKESTGT
jgi:tetratricopeptide (TPR) repeat protein